MSTLILHLFQNSHFLLTCDFKIVTKLLFNLATRMWQQASPGRSTLTWLASTFNQLALTWSKLRLLWILAHKWLKTPWYKDKSKQSISSIFARLWISHHSDLEDRSFHVLNTEFKAILNFHYNKWSMTSYISFSRSSVLIIHVILLLWGYVCRVVYSSRKLEPKSNCIFMLVT